MGPLHPSGPIFHFLGPGQCPLVGHGCPVTTPELYQHHFPDPQTEPFIVSSLLRCIAAGGSFLCDKVSVLSDNTIGTPASSFNIHLGQSGTGRGFAQCSSVFFYLRNIPLILMIDSPDFESQQGQKIFLPSTWPITALGPTQPRINWAKGHFDWRESAAAWPNLQLNLFFPCTLPCRGQEKFLVYCLPWTLYN